MANTTIQIKKSSTPSSVPSSLEYGEIAINYADGKIFFKNSTGVIVSSNLLSLGTGSNAFGTVNANNVLITADTSGDVLRLDAGNNISIVGDAVNNRIIISSTGGTGDSTIASAAFDKANSANIVASAAFDKANTGSGTSITTFIVTGTSQTAQKDYRYVLTNASATTVTLPPTPSLGDTVYISAMNSVSNNIVARNGSKIMALSENMTIDIEKFSFGLTYVDANLGWILV